MQEARRALRPDWGVGNCIELSQKSFISPARYFLPPTSHTPFGLRAWRSAQGVVHHCPLATRRAVNQGGH